MTRRRPSAALLAAWLLAGCSAAPFGDHAAPGLDQATVAPRRAAEACVYPHVPTPPSEPLPLLGYMMPSTFEATLSALVAGDAMHDFRLDGAPTSAELTFHVRAHEGSTCTVTYDMSRPEVRMAAGYWADDLDPWVAWDLALSDGASDCEQIIALTARTDDVRAFLEPWVAGLALAPMSPARAESLGLQGDPAAISLYLRLEGRFTPQTVEVGHARPYEVDCADVRLDALGAPIEIPMAAYPPPEAWVDTAPSASVAFPIPELPFVDR